MLFVPDPHTGSASDPPCCDTDADADEWATNVPCIPGTPEDDCGVACADDAPGRDQRGRDKGTGRARGRARGREEKSEGEEEGEGDADADTDTDMDGDGNDADDAIILPVC